MATPDTRSPRRARIRTPLLGLAALVLLAGAATAASRSGPDTVARDIDRILVIVNDDVITEIELNNRVEVIRKRISGQNMRAPSEDVLRKQVLEHLIVEHLQLQLARQAGIQIDTERLDQAIAGIARQNQMTPEQLYDALRRDGVAKTQFRDQIRDQILIQQLLEREINNRILVSESEVENFLANQGNGEEVEYQLSHILIALPESASPEAIQQARQRAEALRKQLTGGADFAQAAIANSQGQNALEGGQLGWKKPGQLPALFVDALKSLRAGDISEVLRSPNGFHILKLHEARGGGLPVSVTQTRIRHILIRPNEILSPDEARRRLMQLRERIENGEDFAALARSHSEDPGSASQGGDLGWVSPGQMVPEFERAADALKPGELSTPVRSAFGLHLIQVLERRERDVSSERDQASARQQIHARKADERYEQWVRQLRDEAYVEYRTDAPE
ncbi:MAG TPA: peptidylprolyl isomerase [Acidiferrobacterales bacterium]